MQQSEIVGIELYINGRLVRRFTYPDSFNHGFKLSKASREILRRADSRKKRIAEYIQQGRCSYKPYEVHVTYQPHIE